MRSDPRCPDCDGKVSATAEWCMHCGADFERPVDSGAGDGRHDAGLFGSQGGDTERDGETTNGRSGSTGGEVTESRETVADELGAVLSSDASGGGESGTADRSASNTGYPTVNRDASPTSLSGAGLFRAVADHVVAYVGANESRRETVVLGVPLLLMLFAGAALDAGRGSFVGAGLLAVFLYTRETARETVAASAYGSSALIAALSVADAALALQSDGWAAAVAALAGLVAWIPVLIGLAAVGLWLRRSAE